MSTDSRQKQKQTVVLGTRASLSSSLSSSSSSSSSSPVYDSTSGAISPYSITPRGGTRIMYDRQFLLDCRNSPLARSPLQNLPIIPGVTCDLDIPRSSKPASKKPNKRNRKGSKEKRASPQGLGLALPEYEQWRS